MAGQDALETPRITPGATEATGATASPTWLALGGVPLSQVDQVRPAGAGRNPADASNPTPAPKPSKAARPLKARQAAAASNLCKRAPKHKRPADCAAAAPKAAVTMDQAGDWRAPFQPLRDQAALDQLIAVDRLVNALTYVSDIENWGAADYWETPQEMFARGGDCEGFALTKYFALRDLGLDDAALRVAVVWDRRDREEHAILLAQVDGETWVLDNKTEQPVRLSDDPHRYQLIYSVNEAGARLASAPPARSGGAKPRARVVDGGRTLILTVTPRNRR